jgi:hypothetical protein
MHGGSVFSEHHSSSRQYRWFGATLCLIADNCCKDRAKICMVGQIDQNSIILPYQSSETRSLPGHMIPPDICPNLYNYTINLFELLWILRVPAYQGKKCYFCTCWLHDLVNIQMPSCYGIMGGQGTFDHSQRLQCWTINIRHKAAVRTDVCTEVPLYPPCRLSSMGDNYTPVKTLFFRLSVLTIW